MENLPEYIVVRDNGSHHLLQVKNIVRVQAVRVYSVLYLKEKHKEYVSAQNLGQLSARLDSTMFFRVHKSHLVNLYEIKAYLGGRGGKIIMSDDTVIEVAQRRKTQLLQHLKHLNKKVLSQENKRDAFIPSTPTKRA